MDGKTILTEEFCSQLEYRICHELRNSEDPDLQGFWCDGISSSADDSQLESENVGNNKKLQTIAWIGKTGQTEYKAIIYFGEKMLRSFKKGTNQTKCIPEIGVLHKWLIIDVVNRTIEIKLL